MGLLWWVRVRVVEVNGYKIEPGADLSGADLSGANLTGANLTGANLTGANLTGAVMPESAINNEIREILNGDPKGLIERFRKIRWYRVRKRVNEDWFSWLLWGLLGGSFLVGGLREWAGLEMAWWPFGGNGSDECYFMGTVEICS